MPSRIRHGTTILAKDSYAGSARTWSIFAGSFIGPEGDEAGVSTLPVPSLKESEHENMDLCSAHMRAMRLHGRFSATLVLNWLDSEGGAVLHDLIHSIVLLALNIQLCRHVGDRIPYLST